MPVLRMYWDRVTIDGHAKGIEVLQNHLNTEVPDNACGFRLGLPGHQWNEAWYFAPYYLLSGHVAVGSIECTSEFTGPSPSAIEARGPVHGCSSGSYNFQTPLLDMGLNAPDGPVELGNAGSFIAEFSDEGEIEWLDHAGQSVKFPSTKPPKPPEPSDLPPEFFTWPPAIMTCLRDNQGELHCSVLPNTPKSAAGPTTKAAATLAAEVRGTAARGRAMRPAASVHHGGLVPGVVAVANPRLDAAASPVSDKAELPCPAELVLTTTFHKDDAFEPANVEYRFRFAHGPVSTVFSALVDKPGANSVFHSVPIPLPRPIGKSAPGGGVKLDSSDFAIPQKPEDPIGPGGGTPLKPQDAKLKVVLPPANEHKSSVRVEVLNAEGGVIASDWAPYHLVCVGPPPLRRKTQGQAVLRLQVLLNRSRQAQRLSLLKVDGIFDPRTDAAVRGFQRASGLTVDGLVGPSTWQSLGVD